MKKLLKIVLITIGSLVVIGGILFLIFNEALPTGKQGEEADALAKKVLKALNHKAYKKTQYLEWSFGDEHFYKWDKKNNSVVVSWGENEVHLFTSEPEKSKVLKPENSTDKEALISDAFSYFNNDSFWLVAPYKIFDSGTERRLVSYEGKEALLITYKSGGETPGDSYLWILNENGLPQHYKMWAKIIPVGGLGASWSDWVTTSTGALLPSKHETPFGTMSMGDVKAFN